MTHEADIKVVKETEDKILVVPKEAHTVVELSDYFSFEKEVAQHQRRFRKSWDGVTRLYSSKTGRLPAGLLSHVYDFAARYNYTLDVDPELTAKVDIKPQEMVEFINNFIKPYSGGKPIKPHDYQYLATYHALKNKRATMLAATSAGKSLIIYLIARILELSDDKGANKRILITVPTTSLVEQLYADFEDYANNGTRDWIVSQHVQKVSGQYEKTINRNIVISTWQSAIKFYNLNEFGVWINDETHNGKSASIKEISRKMPECSYRIGLTGTLDGVELHSLEIQGVFGPVKRIIKAIELQEQGKAAKTKIFGILLKHPDSAKRMLKTLQAEDKKLKGPRSNGYEIEMQYLMSCPLRNQYIINLAKELKGNTIILTGRIDAHLLPLLEQTKEATDRPVFAIHGGVDANEREQIRQILEQYDNAIIWASYGTMSTGVSIKKLHNLVFAYPMKAKIKVLQSIGRLMRLHKSKELAKIIDIGDNLAINNQPNFTMSHMRKRMEYYFSEGWKVNFLEVPLTDKG